MYKKELEDEYFEWLCDVVCEKRFARGISYSNLLRHLHNIEFIHLIKKDINRAKDGINLRYRFSLVYCLDDVSDYLEGPCSVLEMLIALAIRCEEDIMDDPYYGNRTGQWFWGMITNLGLGSMTDDRFDLRYVNDVIDRFLHREYDPDGKGGLFYVRNCDYDLRDVEIWYQMCWYLDTLM